MMSTIYTYLIMESIYTIIDINMIQFIIRINLTYNILNLKKNLIASRTLETNEIYFLKANEIYFLVWDKDSYVNNYF